ncbi:MAG: enoyl-CoA hydratase/isomerase family protein [Pyrodictiaceae archaeon]
MPVKTMLEGSGFWVVIDRLDKANALDYEHLARLREAIELGCKTREANAVVITGSGDKYFSTGVDLGSVANVKSADEAFKLMVEGLGNVCRAILDCRKPVIAAVNGHAIGIGFELLYAVDIAVAVRHAKFSTPAVKWGMIPPMTTTLGPFLIGLKNASYLALTGATISAEEALRMGIINEIVDDIESLRKRVMEIIGEMGKASSWAISQARRLLSLARERLYAELGLMSLGFSTARLETIGLARSFLEKKRKAIEIE